LEYADDKERNIIVKALNEAKKQEAINKKKEIEMSRRMI